LSGIYAAVFRIFATRHLALVFLWTVSLAGFVLGQVLADHFVTLFDLRLGATHIVESSLAAWLAMLVVNRVAL